MSDSSSLPIDINCGKLLEWLQSRRHCSKDWQQQALNVRAKIAQAIQDMPEHPEILAMLSGAYINYFHCLRIVEILKTTDSSTKNIFGRYSSQRVKDWQEIMQAYEKDNLYLSECAQILQQYTQYEIPALKKQLARCQTTEQECERKQVEYEKLCKECDKKYREDCKKMGLAEFNTTKENNEKDLKLQLIRLADDLPQRFDKLVENFRELLPLMEYYEKFRNNLTKNNNTTTQTIDEEKCKVSLRSLNFIVKNGNVTAFEWKYGCKPDKIERIALDVNKMDEEDKENEDTIDFGVDDVIDFGGIEEVASGEEETGVNLNVKLQGNEKVARLDEALTLLEHNEFLKALNRNLKELLAFLMIRHLELKRQNSSSGDYSVTDVDLVGNFDLEYTSKFLSQINALLSKLNDDANFKRCRRLRVSPVYLNELAELLRQPLKNKSRFEQLKKVAAEKIVETRNLATETKRNVDLLIERSKELQKRLEMDISKRYQNRPVNIVGSTVVVKT